MTVSIISHAFLRWLTPVCFLTLLTQSSFAGVQAVSAGSLAVPLTPSLWLVTQFGLYGGAALAMSTLLVAVVRRRGMAGTRTHRLATQDIESFLPLLRPRAGGATRTRTSILHVGKFYPPHMGGIETHLQVLCEGLQDKFSLHAIVSNDDATTVEENIAGVAVSRLAAPIKVLGAPICPSMVHRIRFAKSDITHLHLPNPAAAAAWLASGRRGKLVVTYHSDIVRQKYIAKVVEPVLHAVLRRSSAIVVSSPEMIRFSPVLAQYRDRCHVIPFGIPLDQFSKCDRASVEDIRDTYGDRVILSVGRLVYYKGFEYLIRAMAHVRGRLVIVGKGPMQAHLEGLIAELGLTGKVTLLGNVPDVVPYYHAADVFALPSCARSEAFGIVQIEAMAAGLPVVNTNLETGVPYVSLHGRTGLTVPPADSDALASALNLLLDNRQLRESMGRAARLRAHTEFSDTAMIGRMTALYEQVMDPRPARRSETAPAPLEFIRAKKASA